MLNHSLLTFPKNTALNTSLIFKFTHLDTWQNLKLILNTYPEHVQRDYSITFLILVILLSTVRLINILMDLPWEEVRGSSVLIANVFVLKVS